MADLTTLSIPAKLERVARIDTPPPIGGTRAGEDGPTEYRVRIAMSSDKPYRRWFGDEVLGHGAGEIDDSRLRAGAPALTDHENETDAIVGRLENHSIDADGVLRCDVVFDSEHEPAMKLYARIARGFVKDVSVGYSVQRWQVTERENGVDEYRAIRWTPMEASFVAVPADASVGANREVSGTALVSVPVVRAPAPASEARSDNVSDKPTVAPEATPQPAVPPAPTREAELAELAQITGRGADLLGWITSGKSVPEVRADILAAQRKESAPVVENPKVEVKADREAEKPFDSFAEYLRSVKDAATGVVDKRLLELNRAASGMGVAVGADGGFLVAPQFATDIVKIAFGGGEILSRVNQIPVSGNQYKLSLIHETARTNGNRWGGVRGYWMGEGDTFTASRPKMRQMTLDVTKKYGVLAYASAEQLEDATATSTVLQQAFAEELTFGIEQSIWEGNGVGQPLGFINSGALVSVAAEGGQGADTIVAANVVKMKARVLRQAWNRGVWFINQDAEPQLHLMTLGDQPVYLPAGGLSGQPFGSLLGRPVIPVEFASTIGDVGDLVFADLGFYALGTKAASALARSMHVRFLQEEEAFRMSFRVDGAPMLDQPITPLKGSNTLSAFVALAAR